MIWVCKYCDGQYKSNEIGFHYIYKMERQTKWLHKKLVFKACGCQTKGMVD